MSLVAYTALYFMFYLMCGALVARSWYAVNKMRRQYHDIDYYVLAALLWPAAGMWLPIVIAYLVIAYLVNKLFSLLEMDP